MKEDNWISVKDKLPPKGISVLLYGEYMGVCEGYLLHDYKPTYYGIEAQEWEREYMCMGFNAEVNAGITHWMPLPEPPKNNHI